MSSDSQAPRFLYVLSTGRCGTQSLAHALSQVYGDEAEITHEPIGPAYRPKETLRQPERLARAAGQPPLGEHLAWIEGVLEERSYIECGWPGFAAVPLFVERFGRRFRLLQLVRHPVPTAMSYVTHGFYQPSLRDDAYTSLAALEPFDPGIVHRRYESCWEGLSPFEKSLFQWLEIHTWAEEFRRRFPEHHGGRIRMEDVFSERGASVLNRIVELAALPPREALHELRRDPVDAYRRTTREKPPWGFARRHEEVWDLSAAYGYALRRMGWRRMIRRYRRRPQSPSLGDADSSEWRRKAKRLWKRLRRGARTSTGDPRG